MKVSGQPLRSADMRSVIAVHAESANAHFIRAKAGVAAVADALQFTPSAVSQQLAKLEQQVGQQLLEANGRGVRLTDAAQLLATYSDEILSLVERAETDLEAKRNAVVGALTLAAFATAARQLVPPALADLRMRYPDLRTELREMEPEVSLGAVSRGDIDLAIVDDWFNAPRAIPDKLANKPLFVDVADAALPADHPLANRRVLELAELADQAWITWPQGSICHDWLTHTLRGLGAEPNVAHTAMEHATQLALVAAGLGAAIVPRLGRDHVPDGVRMVPVRPALSRTVHAVWRKDAARRPAIAEALRALQRHAPDNLSDEAARNLDDELT